MEAKGNYYYICMHLFSCARPFKESHLYRYVFWLKKHSLTHEKKQKKR